MLPKNYHFAVTTLLCLLLVPTSDLAAQSAYTVQGITPPDGGNGTYPQQINDAGDVHGYSWVGGVNRYIPFVYRNGQFSTITGFGGRDTWTNDMNASGVVVGYSYLSNNSNYRAFMYDGAIHDLGTFNGSYS